MWLFLPLRYFPKVTQHSFCQYLHVMEKTMKVTWVGINLADQSTGKKCTTERVKYVTK